MCYDKWFRAREIIRVAGQGHAAVVKMVTSNKLPDKKIVKMADQNNSIVIPQRTLLGEVNEHITCPLCRGYYIDATTIVECLHSFCRSCIIKHLQVESYCPVCEMMINSAKPNIKLDKALQDIVYKLVPGLFQKEMERRQQFYASRPGPAASATPEQRGEDTERVIFSPEDVISFSLEYSDATDTDSMSSKSSDSGETQPTSHAARRYLQCPAVVNVSHLKKFLSMKFDIDSSHFVIDILYKRVPLPDYYTLMDIAYIYNWKRNEPMRFFYQIIDFIAIRSRLYDINRKSSHFRDRKPSPASTEDTNVSSPAPNLNEHGSEASSGTDSPMPDEGSSKQACDTSQNNDKSGQQSKLCAPQPPDTITPNSSCPSSAKKNDDEVEKSQFLNSFELTAKSNSGSAKSSPVKASASDTDAAPKSQSTPPKVEDTLKRKSQTSPNIPEMKKLRVELEKTKLPMLVHHLSAPCNRSDRAVDLHLKAKDIDSPSKGPTVPLSANNVTPLPNVSTKDVKPPVMESQGTKRPVQGPQNMLSPKHKALNESSGSMQPPSAVPKTVSPLKLQVPKLDAPSSLTPKLTDVPKPAVKKIPDLKPSNPTPQSPQNKLQPINKLRMDLLANNSDPTIDRSKILSQVKSSLSVANTGQNSADPLKSLFDSCKINIPQSLSITLTDQKQDPRNPGEVNADQKNSVVNKNLAAASNAAAHKVPSPPVHNYIEILKLPNNDPKQLNKPHNNSDTKPSASNKPETAASTAQSKLSTKTSETSAKGPVPNLKPIADTKLGKQGSNFGGPITFQQTFEKQLQCLQSDKKSKLPKNKAQVPKLVPATPKAFSAASKLSSPHINSPGMSPVTENKNSTALDLSTPHNVQSQLSPHRTKAFETMQSIANLAKKQNLPSKGTPQTLSQGFSSISGRLTTTPTPLRVPSTSNVPPMKLDKINSTGLPTNNLRQELPNKTNQLKSTTNASATISSASYQIPSHNSPITAQPPPRPQTRSPSSSPKLVIAEEKQVNIPTEQNLNQSNQITSTQLSNMNANKSESTKASPGPSKPGLKPSTPAAKNPGIRPPVPPSIKPNPTPTDLQIISAHQALLRHQMEMNAWIKQRQYDLYKNISIAHQAQNDFNNKDKQ